MRLISFFIVGIFFGITMTKSEAISWFRIHEMFRFESFHMYGIIGVAVVCGMIWMWLMKKFEIRTLKGTLVQYMPKKLNFTRFLVGGSIFGLGWALIGACPGPIYVMIGNGYAIFVLVLLGAVIGTFIYGSVKQKLPH